METGDRIEFKTFDKHVSKGFIVAVGKKKICVTNDHGEVFWTKLGECWPIFDCPKCKEWVRHLVVDVDPAKMIALTESMCASCYEKEKTNENESP